VVGTARTFLSASYLHILQVSGLGLISFALRVILFRSYPDSRPHSRSFQLTVLCSRTFLARTPSCHTAVQVQVVLGHPRFYPVVRHCAASLSR